MSVSDSNTTPSTNPGRVAVASETASERSDAAMRARRLPAYGRRQGDHASDSRLEDALAANRAMRDEKTPPGRFSKSQDSATPPPSEKSEPNPKRSRLLWKSLKGVS